MIRRSLIALLAGAALMTASTAQAQTTAQDAAAVQALLDEYAAAWAAADAERLMRLFTDDAEWVNVVGMHWRGKAENQLGHHVFLTTIFRGRPLTLLGVDSVRPVGDEVVVAVARWATGGFTAPDGAPVPASDNRMSLVLRRAPEGLRIAHGANVVIDPVAARNDPAKGPPRD